jgi:Arm DNA-binding domain
MQGHIHKRVHTAKNGQQTTRWYVVVDVGTDVAGRRRQKWHGGFSGTEVSGRERKPRSLGPG